MKLGDCYDDISNFMKRNKKDMEYTIAEIIPGINSNFGKYYGKVILKNGITVFIEMMDGGSREITEEKYNSNVNKREKFVSSITTRRKPEDGNTAVKTKKDINESRYRSIQEYVSKKEIKVVRAFSKIEKGVETVIIVTEKGEVLNFKEENNCFILVQYDNSANPINKNEPR